MAPNGCPRRIISSVGWLSKRLVSDIRQAAAIPKLNTGGCLPPQGIFTKRSWSAGSLHGQNRPKTPSGVEIEKCRKWLVQGLGQPGLQPLAHRPLPAGHAARQGLGAGPARGVQPVGPARAQRIEVRLGGRVSHRGPHRTWPQAGAAWAPSPPAGSARGPARRRSKPPAARRRRRRQTATTRARLRR